MAFATIELLNTWTNFSRLLFIQHPEPQIRIGQEMEYRHAHLDIR